VRLLIHDLCDRGRGGQPIAWPHNSCEKDGETAYLLIYVDDLLLATKPGSLIREGLIAHLESSFQMTKVQESNLMLGLKISRDRDAREITLSCPGYIDSMLQRFGFEDAHPVKLPLNANTHLSKEGAPLDSSECTKTMYQAVVGSLMWASITCRPDIAFAVSSLSRFTNDPKQEHWIAAKHVLRYLKGTTEGGVVLGGKDALVLHGYSDATWGGDYHDPKSTAGYVFLFGGPVAWASRKQATVALSSTEAEYMALSESAKEALYLRQVIAMLEQQTLEPSAIAGTVQGEEPMEFFVDNMGAQALANNPGQHRRTKHINMRYHMVRDNVSKGEIDVRFVPTNEMAADMFTKALSEEKLRHHLKTIKFTATTSKGAS
jgi:hypothetical protein